MRRICALALLGGAAAAAVRRDRAQALEALFDDPSTVDHDFAPSVPLRPLASTAPSVTVELPDLERGLKAKVPGRGVSTWGDALEPPYFTCERDCMGLLPELEIRAPPPVPDVALADYRVDLNTHRELGPRVPCVPNWDAWVGVGEPGCRVLDLGGRDCGPGSEFELMLTWTCSRLCVQKFEADEGCSEADKKCNPVWKLAGYDKPHTCERQCDTCKPDHERPAAESTCAAGADLKEKRPSWNYFPLAHRGPRRPPGGNEWANDLMMEAKKGVGKLWEKAIEIIDKPEDHFGAKYDTVIAELDKGGCKGGTTTTTSEKCKLPEQVDGAAEDRHLPIASPAVDMCPCECAESLRRPTECINAFVQARGTPQTPMPMDSAECQLKVGEGHSPVPASPTDKTVVEDEKESEKEDDEDDTADETVAPPEVLGDAAKAVARQHRMEYQSEQMEAAGIPSIGEGAQAKAVSNEWITKYSDGQADKRGEGMPFSDGGGILDTSKGIAPATKLEEVRPLAAAEACWCQGAIQQPRGFEWSDYYSQYYGALRACEARTCTTCLVLVNKWWRHADEARPEEACSKEGMPGSRVCVDMMVDLQETSAALKQTVAWEIATAIQKPDTVGKAGESLKELDENTQWELMHTLIENGAKKACVQLGCCQSPGI